MHSECRTEQEEILWVQCLQSIGWLLAQMWRGFFKLLPCMRRGAQWSQGSACLLCTTQQILANIGRSQQLVSLLVQQLCLFAPAAVVAGLLQRHMTSHAPISFYCGYDFAAGLLAPNLSPQSPEKAQTRKFYELRSNEIRSDISSDLHCCTSKAKIKSCINNSWPKSDLFDRMRSIATMPGS